MLDDQVRPYKEYFWTLSILK